MSINIGGHLDIGVSHPLLNVLERKSGVDQQAGAAVTKFVQPNMGHPMLLQQGREFFGDIVRRIRMSVRPFEHIIALQILFAKQPPVFLFLGLCSLKDAPGLICQWERSVAGGVLCLVLLHCLCHLGDCVPIRYRSSAKVNAVPLQPRDLTSAQPVDSCDLQ